MKLDRNAEIAKRGDAIWELEGRPNGRQIEHWLRAAGELGAAEPSKPRRYRSDRARRPD
ncbi:MAG: DUF2934 domain-containing protein [Stellaceae bacterium]